MLWFDDQLHDDTTVPFDVADRGLLLGDGVFDTAMVLGGRMIFRDAHIARLAASCRTLGFVCDLATVNRAVDALLTTADRGALRITVTRGPGPRGLAPPAEPRPMVMASMPPLRAAVIFAPARLTTASIRRNDTSPTAQLKTLDYLDAVLASQEAIRDGFDDALFLNTRGHVACASIGNVFALTGRQLVTAPRSDGIVPGIIRSMLLQICGDLGFEPIERSLTRDDLDRADEILVTNSLKLIAPVTAIDQTMKATQPGRGAEQLIARLCESIQAECGVDPRRLERLEHPSRGGKPGHSASSSLLRPARE